MPTTGYVRLPAREAADTMHDNPGQVEFGDQLEVVLTGTPDELRRFADKIVKAADRHEHIAATVQVREIAGRAGVTMIGSRQ